MLRILRELESNIFAMMLALFAFIIILFIIAVIANAIFGVDWTAVIGLGGMGTGSSGVSGISQALSNRSPNYQPLVANPAVTPLPGPTSPKPRDPGDMT